MPIPLGVKNYGLGLCEVRLLHFLMATVMVDIPFSALWSSVGSSCRSLSEALNFQSGSGPAVAARVILGRVLPSLLILSLLSFLAWRWWRRRSSMDYISKKDIDGMPMQ